MIIIAILAVMCLPLVRLFRERAYRVACAANLKSLYIAAAGSVQDNQHWPQIRLNSGNTKEYSEAWATALKPYGIAPANWICPGIQARLGNPNYSDPKNFRADYSATTFDDNPATPYRWPNQPWFLERADVHGSGQLLILTDSRVIDLKEAMKLQNTGAP